MKPHSVLQSAKVALTYCGPLSVCRLLVCHDHKTFFQDVDDLAELLCPVGRLHSRITLK